MRPVASANMSLGGGRSAGACDADVTKPAIDQLRAVGVATAIAAGNDGFADAVSFPGCISSAVTVGSTTKADAISSFSNRGPQIDVFAPGSQISSSVPGGTFSTFSGTSMAAPHVAGAFAALRSARPTASLADLERALVSTGVAVEGRRRIALARALQALPARSATETPMVAAAGEPPPPAPAEIAALPADRLVRVIVKVRAPANAAPAAVQAATKRASDAALAAGAVLVEPMARQPLIVVEAKPAQLQALMRSGAVESMQIDRAARPQ
jgi:subtilisin family serine protease